MHRSIRAKRPTGAVLAIVLAVGALAAGLAQAQVEPPPVEAPDTELTPTPKDAVDTGQWALVGGATYGDEGELVKNSPTPFTVDFFTTSFSPNFLGNSAEGDEGNPTGLFGGAECIDESTPFEEVERCPRRPAIYRFFIDDLGDTHIDRMPLPDAGPGFVGEIAWIDGERALAVGGTGTYPRREPVCDPDLDPGNPCESDEDYARFDREHRAGDARAWIYEDPDAEGAAESSWRELEDLPDEMSGLTALDCASTAIPDAQITPGTCLAGGLRQLWWWRPAGGGMADGFRVPAVTQAVDAAGRSDFHYRVRDIAFSPAGSSEPYVVAATSGCCPVSGETGTDAPAGGARMLSLERSTLEQPAEASDQALDQLDRASRQCLLGVCPPVPEERIVPEEVVSQETFPRGVRWRSESLAGGAEDAATAASLPDSYFAVFHSGQAAAGSVTPSQYAKDTPGVMALAVPGGPVAAGEPGTRIVTAAVNRPVGDPDLSDRKLAALRLVSADGDLATTKLPHQGVEDVGAGGDGIFDWAVGSHKDTGKAAVYTTAPSFVPLLRPLTCPSVLEQAGPAIQDGSTNCDVASENFTNYKPTGSQRVLEMPLFALNSFTMLPSQVGWAAGDRGALAVLGGSSGLAGSEPPGPQLRPRPAAPLPDQSAFEAGRPPVSDAGNVPSLAAQPTDELSSPALSAYGTADSTRWFELRREQVSAIAMSRDGSEGWAVGSGRPYAPDTDGDGLGGNGLALERFDGERWTRCDIEGFSGVLKPDSACADLKPVLQRQVGGKTVPPTLFDIERIPLERDDDPSNDDEFEAIAVGSELAGHATLLAYRDGRWEVDPGAANAPAGGEASIAFVRPDDGWMSVQVGLGVRVLHYTGGDWPTGKWVPCPADPSCGANANLIPSDTAGDDAEIHEAGGSVFLAGTRRVQAQFDFPFVLARGPDGGWVREYDPGCAPPSTPPGCQPSDEGAADSGRGDSLAVTELDDGSLAGWLLVERIQKGPAGDPTSRYALLRRTAGESAGSFDWVERQADDAAEHYLSRGLSDESTRSTDPWLVSAIGSDGEERSLLLGGSADGNKEPFAPPLEYDPDPEEDRWEVMPAPFISTDQPGPHDNADLARVIQGAATGLVTTAAADGQGGLWLGAVQSMPHTCLGNVGIDHSCAINPHYGTFFYRYANQRRRPLFEDSPSPLAEPVTDLDGDRYGTVWVSTESDRLYRYDRLSGWQRVRIPGWDPGRVVTRPSSAFAVAVNEAGTGIAVGQEGRIADLGPDGVQLNPAAGRRCSDTGGPPCATSRDLVAADVAPDGSAFVGGANLTLLWRPAGGDFRTVPRPRASLSATVTGISMPASDSVWITISSGEIFRGIPSGESWRWSRESAARAAADERRSTKRWGNFPNGRARLNAIAVDGSGAGLAVGDRGAMLERSSDGEWRRLATGILDHLYSIALPPDGYGDGTLVGGTLGVILTRVDGEFHVARPQDFTDPLTTGPSQTGTARIVGLSLAGGSEGGQVEAWAASQVPLIPPFGRPRDPRPHALLHYASGDDPLLHPPERAAPLRDSPEPEPGQLSVAAFGRSECGLDYASECPEFQGSNLFNEVISRRIAEELEKGRRRTGGALPAVFTGDIGGAPGPPIRYGQEARAIPRSSPTAPSIAQQRWRDEFAAPLTSSGSPLFAVPGSQDVSRASACAVYCRDSREYVGAGLATQWRSSFASMPAPWGTAEPFSRDGVTYQPVVDGTTNAAGQEVPTKVESPGGGARTHYALDVMRDGNALARLVFIDDSVAHSLAASDPNQNPVEAGGQVAWLEQVLTRPQGLPAVVVENSPTYSYGPGALSDTQADGSLLESILLRHNVTAVIAGRLGWNGLYYTLASGVHWPCPGGAHPDGPPSTAEAACVPAGEDTPSSGDALNTANELLNGTLGGAIPNVIASTAGGRFGPDGNATGSAPEGYWHGYSLVRIPEDGDPTKVVVEQRPILDWVELTAAAHTLRAGKKLALEGIGREPLGTDTSVRIDEISNAAITHRYDLVEADPDQPWLPKEADDNGVSNLASQRLGEEDPCGPYLCLDPKVGMIDDQSGEVRAGKGNYPRTYALAVLSVGEKTATWPLVFEPRASFRSPVAPPAAPVAVPPPASPPAPVQPTTPSVNLPAAPVLPVLTAQALAPPPLPPSPPTFASQAPLDLNLSPAALDATPPTAVSQPPTPPVNPAPPSGARREARQRQAAAQKSGADSDQSEEGGDGQAADLADSPPSAHGSSHATRHDFTALAAREQPSAWARDALLGGGLGVAALILALGLNARPTPRRRQPELPAPAESRAWSRRD